MTVIFKKSFLRCKEVKEFVRKSRLDEFKRRILEHLDALEAKERKKAKKSAEALRARETMRKAGYPVGTIREWKGKKYIKVAPNKWRPKYDSDSTRGARQSIAAIKKKVSACTTAEELLQVVKENKHRFTDADGKYLPFVKELFGHVSEKKKEIRGGAKQGNAESEAGQSADSDGEKPKYSLKEQMNAYCNKQELYEQIMKHKPKNAEHYWRRVQGLRNFAEAIMTERKYSGVKARCDALEKLGERAGALAQQLHSQKLAAFARNTLEHAKKQREEYEKAYKEHMEELDRRQASSKKEQAGKQEAQGKGAEKPSDKGKEEKPAVVRSPGIMKIRAKYEASPSVEGRKKTVVLPDGSKVVCHYRVVEADAPTASHDEESFSPTEGFPTNENGKNINDRDYEHDTDTQNAVVNMGNNFDARAIGNPPIVTKDGIVVSGNNRTMSSKLAARNGKDGEYLESLREMAEEYGLEESDFAGFKHPRLILEIDAEHEGDYTTKEFAAYNQDDKKTMNNVQKAVKIGKMMGENDIKRLANNISEYESLSQLYDDPQGCIDFVNLLIDVGVIRETDRAQYMSADGSTLNGTGRDFVETVLVGNLLTEENVRACDGAGGRSIRKKLVRAILPLIDNKGAGNECSFNKELNDAVDIAIRVSKNHKTWKDVGEFLEQTTFAEKIDPITGKLAEIIHDERELAFAKRMKDLGAGLRPSDVGQTDLFFGGVRKRDDLLKEFLDIKKAVAAALQRAFGNLGKSA